MRGRRFADRYELQTPLGRGGMAEVWRAWDSRMERAVALKILDPNVSDPAGVERFRREALAVARMAHPNIVAGYDFGTEDGRPYLVMELVAGQTLADRLGAGPLPIPEAVDIAGQACAALEAAHRAGVVHRDLKPANLIVTPDGTVKMLDFGIARLQDAANAGGLTRTQMVVGTSHYMAPEQAAGSASDARTDLYALGCVLYALLTGAPPFSGENPMSVLYQHLHHAPRPIRQSRPEVPAALENLVMGLLAKRPEDRPGSATAVRDALRNLPNSSPQPTAVTPAPSAATAVMPSSGVRTPGRAAVPPPAPPATGVMPSAPSGGNGSRWLLGTGAAVIAVIVLSLLVLLWWPESTPSAGPTSSAPPSSPSPTPAESSPSPSPSPTATDPAGRLAELRSVLATQQASGEVDAEAADRLDKELDDISEEIREDDLDRAARKLEKFRDELDKQYDEGAVSDGAYQKLREAADRLEELLPSDGDRPQPGKGKGKHRDGPGHGHDHGDRDEDE